MSQVSVELENILILPAARERVWDLMTDVPQVIPCIPGGRLVETIDDSTWKAEVALDLGFTRVVFLADVARRDLDEAEGRAVLEITAVDSKGKSTARATMSSQLAPGDGGTQVTVLTDVSMEGEVARFGAGIIEDVSYEIVEGMTGCLQARLTNAAPSADHPAEGRGKLSLWAALLLLVRGRLRRGRRRRHAAR
jgi:uncharacterized protein